MINKKYIFLMVFAAQIIVPFGMIFEQESILENGVEYRFKTAPVDPYDVMRGRYVALATETGTFKYSGAEKFESGQIVYAVLGNNEKGYAIIENVVSKFVIVDNFEAVSCL